jgi:hypothetical protein
MATSNQIGFHVPYSWDEATYMACALADLAVKFGLPVSILPSQAQETNIHYRWDSLVLNSKRVAFEHWHQSCSHIVWFDIQKAKLEMAIKTKCVNIFVPLWQRIQADQVELLAKFDAVVCTHRPLQRLMQDATPKAVYVPWDAGLPIGADAMPMHGTRLFVPVDSYTARVFGSPLLHALRVILDGDANLHITLSYNRNWERPAMAALSDLLRRYPKRVRVLRKPSHAERIEAYLRHDWTFIPSLRENCGVAATESLYCRRPVITFECEPHKAILTPSSASFIPCATQDNWMGVPEVIPNLAHMVDHLRDLVDRPNQMRSLAENEWPWLQSNRLLSTSHWKTFWGLT